VGRTTALPHSEWPIKLTLLSARGLAGNTKPAVTTADIYNLAQARLRGPSNTPDPRITECSAIMDTKKTEDQYGIDIVHNEKSVESPAEGHHLENVDGATSGMEWKNIIQDAIESESAERELNWRQAIKMYPKAIFWSIAISLCIVM
jgi:hypothetical protein